MSPPRAVVALDLSAAVGSAAWMEQDDTIAEIEWPQPPRDNRATFEHLRALLFSEGRHPAQVELWVVGCGPGAYSGLRIATAAIHMFAAPLGRPVIGIDSGLATGDELLRRVPVDDAIIAGDARRGLAWFGRIRRADDGSAELVAPWSLCALTELEAKVPPAGCGGSAEWSRLAHAARLTAAEGRWWPEDLVPRARHLARRAIELWTRGQPLPPALPIYLQPPVATGSGLTPSGGSAV
ncbi:MAG: tRNA (adenosine(37)-N6)-threonylcarbamoyltransferase complex dimerization subunit type 1 TsaB [Kiritimatiellae bacterium]|nr:tRNA (adenosine(37)-N6)-threonylcarbamoyltransferase complex dimerization subunit type 1 TsaB [Kiritimatiellia bacterium]